MSTAKTGSSKKGRGKVRMYNGGVVTPALYNGNGIGMGKYFAAMVNYQLVLDSNGKPMVFRECGELVDA